MLFHKLTYSGNKRYIIFDFANNEIQFSIIELANFQLCILFFVIKNKMTLIMRYMRQNHSRRSFKYTLYRNYYKTFLLYLQPLNLFKVINFTKTYIKSDLEPPISKSMPHS